MKLFVIATFILLVAILACSPKRETVQKDDGWEIIKSPLSGKCYEGWKQQTYWHAIMILGSEVPCTK